MKVRAIQKNLNELQRKLMGVDLRVDPRFSITIGREYVVYSLACVPDSVTYGKVTLYRVLDDFGRLIPVPACLFEISDPQPSKYWLARYEGVSFSLAPVEFIENKFLSEEIFDGEDVALSIFEAIKERFWQEHGA